MECSKFRASNSDLVLYDREKKHMKDEFMQGVLFRQQYTKHCNVMITPVSFLGEVSFNSPSRVTSYRFIVVSSGLSGALK
jgi:hypothetical protein